MAEHFQKQIAHFTKQIKAEEEKEKKMEEIDPDRVYRIAQSLRARLKVCQMYLKNTNPERAYEISISDALRFGLSGEPVEGLTAGYI